MEVRARPTLLRRSPGRASLREIEAGAGNVPRFTWGALPPVLALLLSLLALAAMPEEVAAASPAVEVAQLQGEINAATARYISAAVARAGQDRAGALVITMNTPGGLSTSMDDIVTSLLNAPVPVAVYVAPSGARAASAGLFVAQAADVIAMAPATNIGSAHPVTGSGGDIPGDLGTKVLNDAVARIRNLATLHHRNADWCERAVRASVNVGADEATRIGVADMVQPSLAALLSALDGRPAARATGSSLTFHTAGARPSTVPMPLADQALQVLVDPNVAYLLLLVAIFGIMAEVTTPGAILPGVVGVISGLLALVAFTTLPVNLGGALLIGLSFLLFVLDIKAPTHGVLTVGGLLSLLLGSALLIDSGPVGMGVDPRLILGAALATTVLFFFVVRKAVRARSHVTISGRAALIGTLGESRGPLTPEGQVFVAGAVWRAISASGNVAPGRTVRVVEQDGARLKVELADAGDPRSGDRSSAAGM